MNLYAFRNAEATTRHAARVYKQESADEHAATIETASSSAGATEPLSEAEKTRTLERLADVTERLKKLDDNSERADRAVAPAWEAVADAKRKARKSTVKPSKALPPKKRAKLMLLRSLLSTQSKFRHFN